MANGVERNPDVTVYQRHVEQFLGATTTARARSERCRDYVNHEQWTADERRTLRERKQAPITINRIKPKVEGLKGLLIQQRRDPKAYPRTQAHEEVAHAITDALRYVADNTDLDDKRLLVADSFIVEGYGGALVDVVRAGDDIEIRIVDLPWDRIYYDPHARRHDFKDARFMGFFVWMDREDAREVFGDRVDLIQADDDAGDEILEDRPKWVDRGEDRDRVRIATEYCRKNGEWMMAVFSGGVFLIDPMSSPFVDEDGKPVNPMELASCNMNRDNERFGEVWMWLDLQDEINHRRSKALHLNSVRQTASRKGAIQDVATLKRELAKPDGHVEYSGEKGDFEILRTGDMAQAQFELLKEAKGELDAISFNAQLSGERQGDLSGRAVLALQSASTNEIANTLGKLNSWERRVYRQIWYRIRQFWTREKWIRVTDDEQKLRWVGFNVPMTVAEQLQEITEDESQPEPRRQQAAQMLAIMQQTGDPRLGAVSMVKNEIAELDVDIILDQALDTVNIQAEQFEMVARLAEARPEIPFVEVLRLSQLRDKDDIIRKIEEGQQAIAAAQQQQVAAAMETKQAETRMELEADLVLGKQKADGQRELKLIDIAAAQQMKAIEIEAEERRALITRATDENRAALTKPQEIRMPDSTAIVEAVNGLASAQLQENDSLAAIAAELSRPMDVVRDETGRVVGAAPA